MCLIFINAICLIAVKKKNCLLAAPDTYMEKIAIGPNPKKNLLDLDNNDHQKRSQPLHNSAFDYELRQD